MSAGWNPRSTPRPFGAIVFYVNRGDESAGRPNHRVHDILPRARLRPRSCRHALEQPRPANSKCGRDPFEHHVKGDEKCSTSAAGAPHADRSSQAPEQNGKATGCDIWSTFDLSTIAPQPHWRMPKQKASRTESRSTQPTRGNCPIRTRASTSSCRAWRSTIFAPARDVNWQSPRYGAY